MTLCYEIFGKEQVIYGNVAADVLLAEPCGPY